MQSLVICTQYKYFSLSTFQSTGDEMAAQQHTIHLCDLVEGSSKFLRYIPTLKLSKEIINI